MRFKILITYYTPMKVTKHKFFSPFLFLLLALQFIACKEEKKEVPEAPDPADKIISSIVVPKFPEKDFKIIDYGANGDGETDNSEAIKNTIAACSEAGGGKVIIPKGKFLTGPIHLKSNVNLHLEEGAEVLFTKEKSAYLPVVHTSYEGVELMNYSPLIYAYKQKNIAVTGIGTFNGQADNTNWWPWSGSGSYGHKEGTPQQRDSINLPRLRKMNE